MSCKYFFKIFKLSLIYTSLISTNLFAKDNIYFSHPEYYVSEDKNIQAGETSGAILAVKVDFVYNDDLVITYKTRDGTAEKNLDYIEQNNKTVTIKAGERATNIRIPIYNDIAVEDEEVFYVDIVSVSDDGVSVDNNSFAKVVIAAQDPDLCFRDNFNSTSLDATKWRNLEVPDFFATLRADGKVVDNRLRLTDSNFEEGDGHRFDINGNIVGSSDTGLHGLKPESLVGSEVAALDINKSFKLKDSLVVIEFDYFIYDLVPAKPYYASGYNGVVIALYNSFNKNPKTGFFSSAMGYSYLNGDLSLRTYKDFIFNGFPASSYSAFGSGVYGIALDQGGVFSTCSQRKVGGASPDYCPSSGEPNPRYIHAYTQDRYFSSGTHLITVRSNSWDSSRFLHRAQPIYTGDVEFDGTTSTPAPGYRYRITIDNRENIYNEHSEYDSSIANPVWIKAEFKAPNENSYRLITHTNLGSYAGPNGVIPDNIKIALLASSGTVQSFSSTNSCDENLVECYDYLFNRNTIEIDNLEIYGECQSPIADPPPPPEFSIVPRGGACGDNINTQIVNASIALDILQCAENAIAGDVNVTLPNGSIVQKTFSAGSNKIPLTFTNSTAIKEATVKAKGCSDYECMESTSDKFAIRPKKFSVSAAPAKPKVGEPFTITITAEDALGNPTSGFAEFLGTVTHQEKKPSCNAGQLSGMLALCGGSSCPPLDARGHYDGMGGQFSSGTFQQIIDYSEVGELELNISEISLFSPQEFGIVDAPDSNRFIESATNTIQFLPAKFGLDFNAVNHDNNFTYYANSPVNMGAELDFTVEAQDILGNRVQNYRNGCYSQNTNLSFDYNYTTASALTFNCISANGSVNLCTPSAISSATGGSSTLNLRVPATIFNNGQASDTIHVNFARNNNSELHPSRFNFTRLEAEDENGTSGTLNKSEDMTFYYGRVYAPNYSVVGDTIDTQIFTEVFCQEAISGDCNGDFDINTAGWGSNEGNINWWINRGHALNGGNLISANSLPIITFQNHLNEDLTNGEHTINVSYTGSLFPMTATINIVSDPWLTFVASSSYIVEFINIGNWIGVGDVNTTVDLDVSTSPNRRIDW